MRLLVDAQWPPAFARWLVDRGHSASPVRQVGLRDSDDGSIWHFATAGKWTVITKDEDFVERCLGNPGARQVVWLEPLLPEIVRQLASGQRLVEVRREPSPRPCGGAVGGSA